MPAFSVSESIIIQAPQEAVFDTLKDFKSWPIWSPWLIAEPDSKLTFPADAKSYSWEGNYIGAGKLSWKSETGVEALVGELEFIKPHKGQAETRFHLEPSGDGTRVTWEMDSSLPFFMFFMKKMFTALIAMDYQRGLVMLKNLIEDGEVHSKLEFGTRESPELKIVGVRGDCSISEMGEAMEKAMTLAAKADCVSQGISIYHKWDIANQRVQFTSGFLVGKEPESLPEGTEHITIPATPAFTVTHTGPYPQLGNAWSSGISRERAKAFRTNKQIDPFEIYENDPAKVAEKELITVVHFPTKS